MSENKNIERLFQEKFKDFEVIPQEHVWDNIEAELDKKEKRRIIPFWRKLSGIAAALLFGFLITNALFFSNPIGKNNVANQENNFPAKTQPKGKSTENSNKEDNSIVKEKEAIVASDVKESNYKSSQNKVTEGSLKSSKDNSIRNNDGIASSTERSKNKTSTTTNISQKISGNNGNLNKAIIIENKEAVATNLEKKETINIKNNPIVSEDLEKKETNATTNYPIVSNDLNKEKTTVEKKLFENNTLDKVTTNKENPISKDITNPKSAFENKSSESINPNKSILTENTLKEIKNIDTTKIAVVANALEELLKEKEVKKKAEPKLNRWQVATTVAPIYFSSTSGGSPLDSRFESNNKEFQPSFSYGVGVNYSLNKKWSVRTGVNALALEYKTNNVVFFQTVNARQIEHVKSNLQGSMIQIDNKNSNEAPELSASSQVVEKFNGSLNQKMGYIEVPVEVSYKLMDKKFGIDVITGFSSLFLNENSVSVLSSGETINIGRANNLNDFHFSGNLGVGFRYRFWKAFNANVNPMFKYQMNTFNSDSGNFKPYAFGLYSGISYTF